MSAANSRRLFVLAFTVLAAGIGGGCSATVHRSVASAGQPREPLVGPVRPRAVVSAHGMVVASSPEAARVGARVLEEGGTAVDAAVATVFALMPTDPSSVGPGSDLVMVLHQKEDGDVVLDSPSFVPMRVQPEELAQLKREGHLWGRRVSTVPTILAVLGTAQERYGTWSLQRLMAPAIKIAREGFELGFYQRGAMGEYHAAILASPSTASLLHFQPDGDLPPVHTRIAFPALATTLERLADAGWRDFYRGEIAAAIESDMVTHGGWITRADLGRVPRSVRETRPLEADYRDHRILVPGRPWGGPALVEALEILEGFPRSLLDSDSTDHVHLMIEAVRLAQYDQLRKSRQNLIPAHVPGGASLPSGPWALTQAIDFTRKVSLGPAAEPEPVPEGDRHTTHVDVLDSAGNAVSITVTLGRYFGCDAGPPELGFLYNSLMEGFQFESPSQPQYTQPLAHVRSYLTPTIVLRKGDPVLVLGTGGSGLITSFVLEVLSNVLDRGMTLEQAVAHPRVGWAGPGDRSVYLELTPPLGKGVAPELRRRGFENINIITYPNTLLERGRLGGVDCAAFEPATGTYTGVGDPRREGSAAAPRTAVN